MPPAKFSPPTFHVRGTSSSVGARGLDASAELVPHSGLLGRPDPLGVLNGSSMHAPLGWTWGCGAHARALPGHLLPTVAAKWGPSGVSALESYAASLRGIQYKLPVT